MAEIALPTKKVQDDINTKVGTIDTGVKELLAKGGGGIKKIQQGVVQGDGTATKVVSITAVEPTKTMVLLNGIVSRSSEPAIVQKIEAEQITIGTSRQGGNLESGYNISWQAIEFN